MDIGDALIGGEFRGGVRPTLNDALRWIGSRVEDEQGAGIGRLEDVWVDPVQGEPRWLLIKEGRFGGRHTLVPFLHAAAAGGRVWIPYSRGVVRAAPEVKPGAPLSSELEHELTSHYRNETPAVPSGAGPAPGEPEEGSGFYRDQPGSAPELGERPVGSDWGEIGGPAPGAAGAGGAPAATPGRPRAPAPPRQRPPGQVETGRPEQPPAPPPLRRPIRALPDPPVQPRFRGTPYRYPEAAPDVPGWPPERSQSQPRADEVDAGSDDWVDLEITGRIRVRGQIRFIDPPGTPRDRG